MTQDTSRILVRLPAPLHGALKAEANKRGITLNKLCLQALRRGLAEADPEPVSAWPALRRILESSIGPRLCGAVLFGSRARGDAARCSDTDLLLCLAPGERLTRGLYAEWDALAARQPDAFPPGLSPHFSRLPASPESAGSLWLEVAVDGIVLWDPHQTVSRFLAGVRRYLLGGKAVRKESYGVPYWVRGDAKRAAC